MRIEDLGTDDLELLDEDLSDIRHDLGKYLGFATRFLGVDASEDDLREALRSDLLATRRHGDRVEAAWEVWARLRPARLDGDEDVTVIDERLAELSTIDLTGPLPELRRARGLAREVTEATIRMVARVAARRHP